MSLNTAFDPCNCAVDVTSEAEKHGLEIYQSQLPDGISGALIKDSRYDTKSGFVIFVDEDEPYVRQRFTAAHEIGHYILHRDKIGEGIKENYMLRAEGSFGRKEESEANKWAADLLMPYSVIKRLNEAGYTTIESLADALKVSKIAMAIRLGHPT